MTPLCESLTAAEKDRVFQRAAEWFAILATPMRLRIMAALCDCEKSVSQLLADIDTTQPNLSQHLNLLYRAGVLARRKEGTQVFYRVQSEQAVALCRTVCGHMAQELRAVAEAPEPEAADPMAMHA